MFDETRLSHTFTTPLDELTCDHIKATLRGEASPFTTDETCQDFGKILSVVLPQKFSPEMFFEKFNEFKKNPAILVLLRPVASSSMELTENANDQLRKLGEHVQDSLELRVPFSSFSKRSLATARLSSRVASRPPNPSAYEF